MNIALGSGWKRLKKSSLPYGATPIGTVDIGGGDGILVRTAGGFYAIINGALVSLPKEPIMSAIAEAACNLLPQVTGAKGGKSGRGASKVRGDSEYYSNLRKRRAS